MARRTGILSDAHSIAYCLEYNAAPIGYYNATYQELPPNPNLSGIKTPRYVASVNKPSLDVMAVNLGKLLHQNKQMSADFIMEKMLLNVRDFKPPEITLNASLANTSPVASITPNVAFMSNGNSIKTQANGSQASGSQSTPKRPPLKRQETAPTPVSGNRSFYKGRQGNKRLVREETSDGIVTHFEGEMNNERMVRVEHPDGNIVHYEGERFAESPVRTNTAQEHERYELRQQQQSSFFASLANAPSALAEQASTISKVMTSGAKLAITEAEQAITSGARFVINKRRSKTNPSDIPSSSSERQEELPEDDEDVFRTNIK
jgi:hypothetical protein